MITCPINYFTDNLIFNNDRSCWAVFKICGQDYDFLDENVKINWLYRTARFLSGIMSSAQLLIIPVEQDNKEYFRNKIKQLDKNDPLYENAKFHAMQTETYLEQLKETQGNANDYNSYIVVKLAKADSSELVTDMKSAFNFFLKDPFNAINALQELDTKDILMSKMNDCIKMANDWYYEQNKKLRLVEVSCTETQWLLRRMAYRGLNKRVPLFREDVKGHREWKPKCDVQDVGEERIVKPYQKDVVNLFSGTIHPGKRMLKIEHDKNMVSYQSFLTIAHLPDEMEYPGNEWIYMLQQYNLQAEVCIHIEAIDVRTARKKLDDKKTEIKSQIEHIEKADDDIPEELELGREYADAMEKELKELKQPMLNTCITICAAADDEELLEQRATTIKTLYEDMNIIVERSIADQVNMFMQCIPSVGCITRDYIMPITPITLSSGVIGATHELGDKEGHFIGTTGIEEKQVFLDMALACLRNMSASALFSGNLGVGKSFNANLLVFLNVLYGGYGLIFDPKAERGHWETQLKPLEGMITTITLDNKPENKGKLDPYNIYRDDLKSADELAMNVLAELLKLSPTSLEYTTIQEAQQMMEKSQDDMLPSMTKLINVLNMFPEDDELRPTASHLARRLRNQARSGMSQLLFGDGTEDAITFNNRLNILQIDNLKLPSPTVPKESYTAEEMMSTVLMAVISNFAKRFAMVKRDVFTTILFDESWMLKMTDEGRKLYDFLSRQGRSLFTGCIFNGHSVKDVEGFENTITYKFCFRTNNDEEAERVCKFMNIEPSVSNKETIKSLGNAECLFQDLDGHVGILHFDAVFQDIIDVFNTTPKKRQTEENIGAQKVPDHEEINAELELVQDALDMIDELIPDEEYSLDLNDELFEDKSSKEFNEEILLEENTVEELGETFAADLIIDEQSDEEFDYDYKLDDDELYRREVY